MISGLNGEAGGTPGKTLKGVGIVIAEEQENGSHKVLGVVFSKNAKTLEELFRLIHGQKLIVSLADIRAGTVTLDRA